MRAAIKTYIRVIDRVADWVGLVAIYLIFVMIGVLLRDSVTRTIINYHLPW